MATATILTCYILSIKNNNNKWSKNNKSITSLWETKLTVPRVRNFNCRLYQVVILLRLPNIDKYTFIYPENIKVNKITKCLPLLRTSNIYILKHSNKN